MGESRLRAGCLAFARETPAPPGQGGKSSGRAGNSPAPAPHRPHTRPRKSMETGAKVHASTR